MFAVHRIQSFLKSFEAVRKREDKRLMVVVVVVVATTIHESFSPVQTLISCDAVDKGGLMFLCVSQHSVMYKLDNCQVPR